MDYDFIENLIVSSSLLLSASIICGIFLRGFQQKQTLTINILQGIISAFTGSILFFQSSHFDILHLCDSRTVLLSVTAAFFGVIPSVISFTLLSILRLVAGGAGTFTGILIMSVAVTLGLLFNKLYFKNINIKEKSKQIGFYLLGLITHSLMLLCFFTLPLNSAKELLKIFYLPCLLIYPFTTYLICIVIFSYINKNISAYEIRKNELRFRTIYEEAPVGVSINNNSGLLYCNSMYEKILGRTSTELSNLDWRNYTHPDDLQEDIDNFEVFNAGKINNYKMTKRFFKPDGSIVWVNLIIASLREKDSFESNDYMCIIQDVTETIEAREQLETSLVNYKNLYYEHKNKQILLQSLFDSTADWIFYKNVDGFYLGCNKAFEKYIGIKEEQLIGCKAEEVFDYSQVKIALSTDDVVIRENRPLIYERTIIDPSGNSYIFEFLKTPYYHENGVIMGIICVGRDITERKKREDKIFYLSYHDTLTGLYNRTFYEEERQRLESLCYLPVSVIVCDVNGLKLINDSFGHDKGNELLISVAEILKQNCRKNDIIFRIGGDEFCVFLPCTDSNECNIIFENIIYRFKESSKNTDNPIYWTSISVGYATKTEEDENLEDTIKFAEEYMYRRKLLAHTGVHSTLLTTIKATLYAKSNETEEHGERMGQMAKELGKILGLPYSQLDSLELAASLHDIGKISVDLSILKNKNGLNEEEWIAIKKHPEVGYHIAQSVPELRPISDIILSHHERWDGTGYPRGLKGENIPLLARIISLVDSYDAMTGNRGYRKAISKQEAAKEIIIHSGTQFDPNIAKLFVNKVLLQMTE